MIVVVEGIERVGKTTLVNKLVDSGFIAIKDEFVIPSEFTRIFSDYSLGKCDSFVAIAKHLNDAGKNVVIDRLHLTEMVYGNEKNRGVNFKGCWAIDTQLANMGAILCYVVPKDPKLSDKLAGEDQSHRWNKFDYYFEMSSMEKWKCNYDTLDEIASALVSQANEYDFYFASPFFNDEQVEREERMIAHLRDLGYRVFSPKEACLLDRDASQKSRQEVFANNCKAIDKSIAVFAVTDGKDMGTIWEAGYAYGINKPVIYFAETLGNNMFNLMLAQSGRTVFLSQNEVTIKNLELVLSGARLNYRGDIE